MAMKFNVKFQSLVNKQGLPCSEIQLFKLGSFVHWSGAEFSVDEEFMNQMMDNFKSMKASSKDQEHIVPIDYNHGSLEYGAEESKAAGWISELIIKEDGLYANVQWTNQAQEMIKNKEFRFVSPEFGIDSTDEFGEDISGPVLYAAALTNRPFLKGMDPVHLKAGLKQNKEGEAMKAKFIKLFSLPSEADENKILEIAEANHVTLSEIGKTLDCSVEKAVETIKALKDEKEKISCSLKEATDELVKFRSDVNKKEAERKVDEAIKAFKIEPAKKEQWLKLAEKDSEMFDSLVEGMKPVVDAKNYGASVENEETKTDLHSVALSLSEEKKISYTDAIREIEKTKPELVKAHINRSGKHSHLQ